MSYYEDSTDHSRKKLKKFSFSRGFSASREKLHKNSGYTMSCFNCAYYYQGVGDKEETCQNRSVLEYDMVVEGHRVYCSYWEALKSKDNNLFKRNGRSILD